MSPALYRQLILAEQAYPNLRLLQLIGNIYGDRDTYYITDDELATAIAKYIERTQSNDPA